MGKYEEIIDALKAGETLVCISNIKVKLIDGRLSSENMPNTRDIHFHDPEDWKIYKEPKWEDNIPEGGVLCKNYNGYIFIVKEYREGMQYPYKAVKSCEPEAIPLTLQEISVFVSNAPSDKE